jgi:hypothetical protein
LQLSALAAALALHLALPLQLLIPLQLAAGAIAADCAGAEVVPCVAQPAATTATVIAAAAIANFLLIDIVVYPLE